MVAQERSCQKSEDRREGRLAWAPRDLPDGRGRGAQRDVWAISGSDREAAAAGPDHVLTIERPSAHRPQGRAAPEERGWAAPVRRAPSDEPMETAGEQPADTGSARKARISLPPAVEGEYRIARTWKDHVIGNVR